MNKSSDAVVKKIYQYAEPNLTLVGWMGFIGFPFYYLVWTLVYPQSYESEWLRGFCTLLLLGLALRKHFPSSIKRYLPYYYLATVTICLPFFFSFNMIMNGWSIVWVMSFMSSIFLHILLVHDTKIMLFQALLSIFSAYVIASLLSGGLDTSNTEFIWSYSPIFLFTYVFGTLFYFRNQVEHETKVSIAKSFGASIAHEMRNPLSALKTSLDVFESSLPSTTQNNNQELNIVRSDVVRMNDVLESAKKIICHANETIDLLLTSIDQSRVSQSTFARHSAQQVIQESLDSYAYKNDITKQLVTFQVADDFEYFGSDILLKYVIYNLLKNSLYYQEDDSFKVVITLSSDDDENYLYFEDNGVGVDQAQLEHIFKDFYTSGKSVNYGLGLPFCKRVMHAFGGSITCESEVTKWTLFTLKFPKYYSNRVTGIKEEVLKSKSILYIGHTEKIHKKLNDLVFHTGIHLEEISFKQAQAKEEYEFEYNLIFIDLDRCSESEYLRLEAKLHFTQARIAILFDQEHQYHNRFSRFLAFYPVDKQQMLSQPSIIDELFFGSPQANRGLIPCKPSIRGKRILIADDNESIRSFTKILLNKQGYQVTEARNGVDVLDILKSESIDLILMDIEMPKLDGFDAAVAIRLSQSDYARIPIIAHTGDDRSETLMRIKQVGMNDYLIKPTNQNVLLDKLSNYL